VPLGGWHVISRVGLPVARSPQPIWDPRLYLPRAPPEPGILRLSVLVDYSMETPLFAPIALDRFYEFKTLCPMVIWLKTSSFGISIYIGTHIVTAPQPQPHNHTPQPHKTPPPHPPPKRRPNTSPLSLDGRTNPAAFLDPFSR